MVRIDFSQLPKSGRRFEAMICELLRAMDFPVIEEPAVGPDGGRDILVERVMRDALGERRERIVVQCKHFAHSGRAVSEKHVGLWHNTLLRHRAQGYLLVVSTTVTENLSRAFIEFSESATPGYASFWSGEKLETLLNQYVGVRDTFFPPEVPRVSRDFGRYGWGIVFAADADHEPIRRALKPLLELRMRQAESDQGVSLYKEFLGPGGVRRGESGVYWLARHGVGPGTPNPRKVPFFLTLVGGPELIDFEFQAQLQVQYYVGRLVVDEISGYSRYAQAVCEAEEPSFKSKRNLTFLAPEVDPVTRRISEDLVGNLAASLGERRDGWRIRSLTGGEAMKQRFVEVFGGQDDSALVFSATHGLSFAAGSSEQVGLQGSLITDLPEPGTKVPPEHYLAAEDLPSATDLRGRLFFLFGCYGAGTDLRDEYRRVSTGEGELIAEKPFVSALAQRMLASGVLALIGHVGRSWTTSFSWSEAAQPETFMAVMNSLMDGEPVGVALQALSKRYAELASIIASIEADRDRRASISGAELSRLKVAMLDAKFFLIMGDPGVKLKFD